MQNPCIVTDEAANIKVEDLAKKELLEYSEIMKDLESKVKEGSEIAKETENVDDIELFEYLDEICSQISPIEVKKKKKNKKTLDPYVKTSNTLNLSKISFSLRLRTN